MLSLSRVCRISLVGQGELHHWCLPPYRWWVLGCQAGSVPVGGQAGLRIVSNLPSRLLGSPHACVYGQSQDTSTESVTYKTQSETALSTNTLDGTFDTDQTLERALGGLLLPRQLLTILVPPHTVLRVDQTIVHGVLIRIDRLADLTGEERRVNHDVDFLAVEPRLGILVAIALDDDRLVDD